MRTRTTLWFFPSTHPQMSWIQSQIKVKDGPTIFPPGISPPLSSSSSSSSSDSSFRSPYISNYQNGSTPSSSGGRISPAVLFIIVILAVIFFISGLLHLLVRFLIKKPSTSSISQSNRYPDMSGSDTLQRQLQQLFHLHDSGLDQAFIDALPVFFYKEIVGLKEPSDCAVCLCEFSEQDNLRLLPICSHAFHINCIDTWLLSNSTCPLCRGTLFTPGLSIENPVFEFDDPREEDGIPSDREDRFTCAQKTVETGETGEIVGEKRVLSVRLGKFRNINDDGVEGEEKGEGETSSRNLDARRCYSMGSYQYVEGDSNLQVALRHDRDAGDVKLVKGRAHNENSSVIVDMEGKKLSRGSKGESFSVSKIWLWSKKGKFPSSSDSHMGIPSSSLNVGLPLPERTQDV
ncbi:RING-H2 finger protein ATL46-like [Macadamia integrifolia]|uniref:RING-H2 finger protein ATL46-like n=1 Tax=Macadamia integrifolia TaxID=60698 RepID=UPI001C4F1D4E|nr:RING-H2 finger protein ATL46-like [Macadamia integrifolia]XP_042497057.1 RING-H2 finger protein ATL46-like [Macadamia integrifolia]